MKRYYLGMTAAAVLPVLMPAVASETITLKYDALGRLIESSSSGSVNNGVATTIAYDAAGNRTSYAVVGSGTGTDGGATGGIGGGGSGTLPPPPPSPAPSFSVSDASATEGGSLGFVVSKTGSTTESFSLNYATADGSAVAGSDYVSTSGTLTFTSSETSKTVSVSTVDDTATESSEVFYLNLSSPTGGATISDSQGAGTISDNDAPNMPPTPQNDSAPGSKCETTYHDVVANDTDPDGDYPLSLVSENSPSATIVSSTTIAFTVSSGGTYVVDYTIQDSRGAQASAQLTVTVSSLGMCN